MLLCVLRIFKNMTVFAVGRSFSGQVGKLLKKGRGALLLCAIRQLKDMMLVALCKSATIAVVDVRIEKGAGTCNYCLDGSTT